MGLSNCTHADSLQLEGKFSVDGMAEWEDEDWDNWCSNCKKPDRVLDLASGATPGTLIKQVPLPVTVKSLKRLKMSYRLVRYYEATGRALNVGKLMWTVMESFEMQWKSLKQKSKETTPNNPKLLRTKTLAKRSDAIKVHLSQVF